MRNKLLVLCFVGIVAVVGAIYIFKVPTSGLLTFGLFLLCPLIHIFMMKKHKH